MKAHPLAELFPLMDGEPFKELCESIKVNGLIHPIIRDNGVIVDGRNRQKACDKTGATPHYREFSDLKLRCSVEDFIWSTNIVRRNLTDDQKAAIQAAWLPQMNAEAAERQKATQAKPGEQAHRRVGTKSSPPKSKGKTRATAAKQAGVSEYKMQQAATVADADPDLLEQVKAGTMPMKEAVKQVEAKQSKPKPAKEPKPINVRLAALSLWGEVVTMLKKFPKENRKEILAVLIDKLEKDATCFDGPEAAA